MNMTMLLGGLSVSALALSRKGLGYNRNALSDNG